MKAPALLPSRDASFQAAFEALCAKDLPRLVELLREKPQIAQLRQGPNGETLLALAAGSGNVKAFDLLLPLSDPAARCKGGSTILMVAARNGDLKMARRALAGCTGMEATHSGDNALAMAVGGDCAGAEALALAKFLAKRSDPAQINTFGANALMEAARLYCPEAPQIVSLLLETHDPAVLDKNGRGALCRAASNRNSEVFPLVWDRLSPEQQAREASDAFLLASVATGAEPNWIALDLAAPLAHPQDAANMFDAGGPEKMPRWAAAQEAKALSQAIGAARESPPAAPGPDAISPAARRL